jgi:DNA-binding IclR family transcriptional regulator
MAKEAWTFLTNHGHILLCLASDPDSTGRELAEKVGVTERAVQRIVLDLVTDGYLEKVKDGRRNRYRVLWGQHLRHPVEAHCRIDDLARMVLGEQVVGERSED